MPSLVSRFHLLLFGVTLAIGGVALVHVPEGYAFPAHWQGSGADWLWPRDIALATAPLAELLLMGVFFLLGRALTKNHLAKTRHILDPALTLLLAVATGCQLGLLLMGIGSDFDMFRITAGGLSVVLLVLAVVIFEAERHSYAGLRMPWPIASDRAWTLVHRIAGIGSGLCAAILAYLAWADPGAGVLAIALVASLGGLPLLAALATLLTRGLR
ncbi:MAG: SdpI family protein [Devosia sp.]|uniref:SdpI family protein n=1 Tax=Devosia sp. TaxID=1871048 RepID=UPI0024CBC173|nr:SdpI family protein [Devosia sp.]UYN99993.1 MAG: SdpI family protein [Devosia sp.]